MMMVVNKLRLYMYARADTTLLPSLSFWGLQKKINNTALGSPITNHLVERRELLVLF